MEHSYNSEIRERCETNRKIKLMNLMRKVPGRPKNLREWFFEQAAGEDYMFRNRETKEFGRKKSNDRMEKRRSGTMIWYSALPAENW